MESSRESGWRHELGRLVQFCACRKPTIAICRVMLLSMSARLSKVELCGEAIVPRQRAQLVPGRVLDLDAVLLSFLLAQKFDLARIEHAMRAFRRRRRLQIAREVGDILFELVERAERGDIE